MPGAPIFPWSTVRALLVAVLLLMPLPAVLKRSHQESLTWTKAVVLGSWLLALTLVLVAEIPSRILYWFDSTHSLISARLHFMQWWDKPLGGNPGYQLVADIVANTVQGVFFIGIAAAAYLWGERHRKLGRFKG